ncbi:hypothetical protein [Helicobacter labetoulli]|uniref:hypothetical protein n=1 Tax=Helicobacter labetoulli TaxID=2315333 RepID=UPI000EF651F9|nr:hypothetical protein [Helicobacter labetoulli]
MGYADWHFLMKDLEENKGARNGLLLIAVLFVVLCGVLFVYLSLPNKNAALETLFVERIVPKTTLNRVVDNRYVAIEQNLRYAIIEEMGYLQTINNPLYKELQIMNENYENYLAIQDISGKPNWEMKVCYSTNMKKMNGVELPNKKDEIYIENPYKETIRSIVFGERVVVPKTETILYPCVK